MASVALHVYSDFIVNDIEAIASMTSSKKKNVLLFYIKYKIKRLENFWALQKWLNTTAVSFIFIDFIKRKIN